MSEQFRCGSVAVVGRPNVGKSTLVNRLVGRKVSIISQRPQTTRTRIMGIKTDACAQIVYVDTPGLEARAGNLLQRYMNRAARSSLEDVDCVLFVIAARAWTGADDYVFELVRRKPSSVLLVINKIDRLKDRASLLPLMKQSSERMAFAEIVPVAALSGENIRDLERSIVSYLPEQKALFPVGQVTDRGERFIAAELVREQIFQVLRQEVPYAVAVGIDSFERAGRLLRVEAVVWVGKPGQKRILVGHQGECLKLIGTQARAQMEHMFGCKVHLELWVKVRSNWADSATLLHTLEYGQAEP